MKGPPDSAETISASIPWALCRACALLLAILAVFALSACGGGGGGGGGSGGASGGGTSSTNPAATLQVSPTSVAVTSVIGARVAPTAQVAVSILSDATRGFYIGVNYTNHGIASAQTTQQGITLEFQIPSMLGVGTFTDTLTVEGCYDKGCTQQITASPQTVSATYTITAQPAPTISSLSPDSADAGAPPLVLAVDGTLFTAESQVLWNGTALSTTFVSATKLTAQVPEQDLVNPATVNVVVSDEDGESAPATFTVVPAAPFVLSSISPTQVTVGNGSFMLTVFGGGFNANSVVAWNGASLATTYVSGTSLRAQVAASQVSAIGTATITVVNPQSSGGTSDPQTLAIVAPTLDAVTDQMNAAHTGVVSFNNVSLPASSTWTVDLGGAPSYPLIVAGTVYVSAAASASSNSQLFALDAATGATLWGPLTLTGLANPAYDNGHLFVMSGNFENQVLQALDPATGITQWSASVAGADYSAPPVARDGIVYTTSGGYVTAFDESTGAPLWHQYIWGSEGAVAVTADGVYGSTPCIGIDLQPAVGTTLWYVNNGCEGGGGTVAVVANGLFYASQASATSSGLVFDAENGATEGSFTSDLPPAVTNSAAFSSSSGTLTATQTDGTVLWTFAGDNQLETSPVVVNNYVFVGSLNGNLYGLDATTGREVWSMNLGAAIAPTSTPSYTGLAAGDGLLLVPVGNSLTAFTLSTSP